MTSPTEVRTSLLNLHKSLLHAERREYERQHGRLENAEFLKVLMEDPQFAWLKPLTALILRLDEAQEEGRDDAEAVEELRTLLAPDEHGLPFQRRYAGVLQRTPDAVVDHGRMVRALAAWRRVRDSNPRALAG